MQSPLTAVTHLSQSKQHRVLGPVGISILDIVRTEPALGGLVSQNVVNVFVHLHAHASVYESLIHSDRGILIVCNLGYTEVMQHVSATHHPPLQ